MVGARRISVKTQKWINYKKTTAANVEGRRKKRFWVNTHGFRMVVVHTYISVLMCVEYYPEFVAFTYLEIRNITNFQLGDCSFFSLYLPVRVYTS